MLFLYIPVLLFFRTLFLECYAKLQLKQICKYVYRGAVHVVFSRGRALRT